MKKAKLLAGLCCIVIGGLAGCDTSNSSTSSTPSASVAGRAALDSGIVTAIDSSGDTVGHARLGHGRFGMHLPEGVRFPLFLTADSSGVKLCTFVPASDSGRQDIQVDHLTDSVFKRMGGMHGHPGRIEPGEWRLALDSLRPALDRLVKFDSLRFRMADSSRGLHDMRHFHVHGDSLAGNDSLRPPRPPRGHMKWHPSPKDTLAADSL